MLRELPGAHAEDAEGASLRLRKREGRLGLLPEGPDPEALRLGGVEEDLLL